MIADRNNRIPRIEPSASVGSRDLRWRILVVANQTVASDIVLDVFRTRAGNAGAEVRVVAPALNGRLKHWSSDDRRARREAEERLVFCLASLRLAGVEAAGRVGDADPLLAMADELRLFAADEIIVATHPEPQSNWLARDIVGRARASFPHPVHLIVVDAVRGDDFLAA